MTDFDAMCAVAHPANGAPGPRQAMDALWTAAFELPQWHFAVRADDPTAPFVMSIGGQTFVFAFTDSARVARFAAHNAHLGTIAPSLSLAMPVTGARGFVAAQASRGVFGVHFNHGQPGWFAPVAAVDRIFAHLGSPQAKVPVVAPVAAPPPAPAPSPAAVATAAAPLSASTPTPSAAPTSAPASVPVSMPVAMRASASMGTATSVSGAAVASIESSLAQAESQLAAGAAAAKEEQSRRTRLRWGVNAVGLLLGLILGGGTFLCAALFRAPNLQLVGLLIFVVTTLPASILSRWMLRPLPKHVDQRHLCMPLIPKLRLAAGAPITFGEGTDTVPLRMTVTLASGVEASIERWAHTHQSTSISGRKRTTTTRKTAYDYIVLRFAAGRFPHLPAVVAALQQQLPASSGAEVKSTATELRLTMPVSFINSTPMSPGGSLPPTLSKLHGLLDPTPVVQA